MGVFDGVGGCSYYLGMPGVIERFVARGLAPVQSVVPLVIFGCMWAAFGIAAFFMIRQWGQAYDRKMAMIAGGKVAPRTLYVVSIQPAEGDRWNVGLSLRRRVRNASIDDYEQVRTLGSGKEVLAVGSRVTGYQFDGRWFIPRFAPGGFGWGQWAALAVGLVPPLAGAGIGALVVRRKRARNRAREAARAASPGADLPMPFTRGMVHFDGHPTEEELLVLMGPADYTTRVEVRETPSSLSARPGALPLRFIVPWMILVAGVITGMAWKFGPAGMDRAVVYVMVGAIWLLVLPVFLVICVAINRHLEGVKDYFQIDLQQRTVALPALGVTLSAEAIEAVIVVERWYKVPQAPTWCWIKQVAALVRSADAGGGFDYYPLLEDRVMKRAFQKAVEVRVGEALGRPVRVIRRGRRESGLLGDGP